MDENKYYDKFLKRVRFKKKIKAFLKKHFKLQFLISSVLTTILIIVTIIIARQQMQLIKMQVYLQTTDVNTNQNQLSINEQQKLINEQLLEINQQFLEIDEFQSSMMNKQNELDIYIEQKESYYALKELYNNLAKGNIFGPSYINIQYDTYSNEKEYNKAKYDETILWIEKYQNNIDIARNAVIVFEDFDYEDKLKISDFCDQYTMYLNSYRDEVYFKYLQTIFNNGKLNIDNNLNYFYNNLDNLVKTDIMTPYDCDVFKSSLPSIDKNDRYYISVVLIDLQILAYDIYKPNNELYIKKAFGNLDVLELDSNIFAFYFSRYFLFKHIDIVQAQFDNLVCEYYFPRSKLDIIFEKMELEMSNMVEIIQK